MAVDAVSGSSNAASSAVAKTKDPLLDQNTFLTLMLAQMKNQDPLKPANPTEFLGQLAQFSTVTSVQDMNKSIGTLADSLMSSQVLNGTSLVGHEVLSVSEEAALAEGGAIRGAVQMPENVTQAELVVMDSAGQLIKRLPLPTQEGTVNFTWDGTTTLGTPAPAGRYVIGTVATIGGANYQLETEIVSRVQSVSIDPRSYRLTLNTDTGPISLADVRRVM